MTNEEKIRDEIINTGVLLLEKGLIQGTGGNISCRTGEGILITPSGMDYRSLLPKDIVMLDMDGNTVSGCRKPSIERSLHLNIYKSKKDTNAVIHTHSVYATAVAAARKPLLPITDNQVAVFGGTVPVADYAPIGTEELARNVSRAIGDGTGVLLANHGALCTGETLSDALMRCQMLEVFSKIFILSGFVGGGSVLSNEQVRCESEDLKKRYGQGQ